MNICLETSDVIVISIVCVLVLYFMVFAIPEMIRTMRTAYLNNDLNDED